MSLFKYFGEQNNEKHNGRLFWSNSLEGFPFRGSSGVLLKPHEIDQYVDIQWDFHCREFDLFNEEDKKNYIYVMDRIVNGWFYLHNKEYVKDKETNRVRYVFLEWSQRYGELSPLYPYRSQGEISEKLNGENNA